jgi:hypothetical protein
MADTNTIRISESDKARFWHKVCIGTDDQCWEWAGGRTLKGYGTFWLARRNIQASHIALVIDGRSRPNGLHALHSCDNPPCVNPSHLRWDTASSNHKEKWLRGRGVQNAPRGEKHRSAKISEDDVKSIRNHPRKRGMLKEISSKYGIAIPTVKAIRCRTTWRHVP